MSILEYFGFKPTLPRLAKRMLRALPADESGWSFDPARESLVHPRGAEVSLRNMFLEYAAHGASDRGGLVHKYVDLILAQSREVPDLWMAAARNVYPVLRSEFVQVAIEIRQRLTGGQMDSVELPFAGDLRVRLMYDFGNALTYLRGEKLQTWGQSPADVLAQAVANLGKLEKPGWVEVGDGCFRLLSPESYGESMLQLDSVCRALPFAAHAVFMPCHRGILLAADGRADAAVRAMLLEASRCLDEEPWPMSAAMCRRSADGWEIAEPAASNAALAHTLHLRHQLENYAAQKGELEAWHQATGEDVYVADVSLVGNGEEWASYCVWAQGVKTLLPVTDWVALLPEHEGAGFIRVPWDLVMGACGSRLQATSEHPPRFLVESFPADAEWDALRAVALPDAPGAG